MNRTNSAPPRVLITDDETDVRRVLAVVMGSEGFDTLEAETGKKALSIVRQGLADIMLLDLEMPDLTGLDVLREVRKLDRNLPIVLISGFASMEAAIEAGKYGVHGFLTKPFKNDEVILAVQMAMGSLDEKCKGYLFCSPLDCELPLREAMGPSLAIQKILDQVELVAPTNFTVVICGETGVGKEVIATTIHRLSPRAAGPLIAVDCGSIPPTFHCRSAWPPLPSFAVRRQRSMCHPRSQTPVWEHLAAKLRFVPLGGGRTGEQNRVSHPGVPKRSLGTSKPGRSQTEFGNEQRKTEFRTRAFPNGVWERANPGVPKRSLGTSNGVWERAVAKLLFSSFFCGLPRYVFMPPWFIILRQR